MGNTELRYIVICISSVTSRNWNLCKEQEPLGIIYIITNKVNSKVYIGQTRKSLSERMRHHFSKYETCVKLKEAIEQYGKENFIYTVLELVPFSELNKREAFLYRKV